MNLWNVIGHAALAAVDKVLLSSLCSGSAMEARGNFFGQSHFGLFRIQTFRNLFLQSLNVGHRLERQQGVPTPHEHIRNRQHLGKHGVGLFTDADVIVF